MRTRTALVLAGALLGAGCRAGGPHSTMSRGVDAPAPLNDDAGQSFQLGTKLYGERKYHEALVAFEQSQRLSPRAVTLFWVAECQRMAGRPAIAYDTFERVLAQRADLGPELERRAETTLAELRATTASLDVSDPEADVEVDGYRWPRLTHAHRVRVGARAVKVSKPGFVSQELTVVLSPNETKVLDVKLEPEKRKDPSQLSEAERKSTAREAFIEGVAFQEKGSWAEAITRFETAQSLYDAPTNLLHLAECQAQIGKLLEARETYETLARARVDAQSPDSFRKAQDAGKTELAALRPRIPTLRIAATPASAQKTLVVLVNRTRVTGDVAALARPMNPGAYKLIALSGGRRITVEIDLKEGESRVIDLKL